MLAEADEEEWQASMEMSSFTTMSATDCSHDGDVNGNGAVTPEDARLAFQYYLGIIELDECVQQRADRNCDGKVTPGDVTCILLEYFGFPCPVCD